MKGGLGRPEAESIVVFCRQDRHFESGLAEGSDPLFGIKVRRSEQGWTFLAVTPLASGEGVHSEMEESGHFQILPIKLLLGRDEPGGKAYLVLMRAAFREHKMFHGIFLTVLGADHPCGQEHENRGD